ncbi:hypothetical protein [Flavobacterium sp.]|uniref:hypothetical protein n=1 Tax=Flavobacterium sp. TaxID=239 RepID=UPI002ED91114
MKKFLFIAFLISLKSFSQNSFSGTWSNENCKDCKKEYIFTITIAQSNYAIVGTAEITSETKKELNSGVLDVSGHVYPHGDKAQIKLKDKNGLSSSAVLMTSEGVLQFTKRGGADLVPNEIILNKIYE